MENFINGITDFESFKLQVKNLVKYLHTVEEVEYERCCIFLENIFKPYFEKAAKIQNKSCETKAIACHLASLSESNKQINFNSPVSNFDSEQSFTEKFLSSVPDPNEAFLSDNLLIHGSVLEEGKTGDTCKDNSFDKNLQINGAKFSPSVSIITEEHLKYPSTSYEIAFKEPQDYLDLSHKQTANFSLGVTPKGSVDVDTLENNSEIILNLCSKNKSLGLKDGKIIQNESTASEDFDSLSYISDSNLLLEERLMERNDSNSSYTGLNALSNTKSTSSSKDINKIFTSTFSNNNTSSSVIHSTNSLKEDRRLLANGSEYHSFISETDDSLSLTNETSKLFLRTPNPNDVQVNNVCMDTAESSYKINSDTTCADAEAILNLKKEPIPEFQSHTKCWSSQEILLNDGLYSIFNSLNNADKSKEDQVADNSDKALNLVNKKNKIEKSTITNNEHISNSPQKTSILKVLNVDETEIIQEVSKENCGLKMQEPKAIQEISKNNSLNQLIGGFGPVCCRHCKTEILDVSLWADHKKSCGMKLYCIHCDITFSAKVSYQKHMTSHKRNTCTQCPSTFSRHQHLRAHMKANHGIKLVSKSFPCPHCPRVLSKRSSIYLHLQSHALPNQKVCSKCGKFIEGEEAYKEHLEEHVRGAALKCHICHDIFQRHQQYNDHMEGHKKHICDYCDNVSFSSKKSLFKHYKTEHPNLPQKVVLHKKYSCDQCPRTFIRPSLLKDHQMIHKDVKFLECHICHVKYYSQRNNLIRHLKNVHSQNAGDDTKRKNVCKECGFSCTSPTALNNHLLTEHNIVITHSCSYCDYKTKTRQLLKRHMHTHLERKKYLCDICGSLFQSSNSLRDHTLFLHSNERSFKCKVCDKSFKIKSCLSRHHKSHSNERPYKCECGSCFKQLSHLTRHLSSAHNKKLSPKRLKIEAVSEEEKNEDALKKVADDSSFTGFCPSVTSSAPTSSTVTDVVDRPTNDILLASSNAVLMADGAVNSDPSPLFTVLDSQFIQLIPSTLQIHQEGIHTVSLVNGELHTLSIAPPSYQINQGENFNPSPSDAIMIQSSGEPCQNSLQLEGIQTVSGNTPVLDNPRENVLQSRVSKHSETAGMSLVNQDLHFTSGSLQDLHYRGNVEDCDNISSLPSTHYLTPQDSSLSQEISSNNISIF